MPFFSQTEPDLTIISQVISKVLEAPLRTKWLLTSLDPDLA